MQIAKWHVRMWTLGALAVIVVGMAWISRSWTRHEMDPATSTRADMVSADTAPSPASTALSSLPDTPGADDTPSPNLATEATGHTEAYPVNLEALRARLPGNRYWALGAPTSDPAVARARAERARRDNTAFGRIQANEATPDEIHTYYAERRAISKDYLELAQLVLAEHGDRLPARDRGMFELSATLHRARLQQIDRDEADALARLGQR
jgi:hypothetical protein